MLYISIVTTRNSAESLKRLALFSDALQVMTVADA